MTAPDDRRCGARSKQTGAQCKAWAIRGTNPPRCRHHAGRRTAVIKAEIATRARAERAYDRAQRAWNPDPTEETTLDDLLRIKNDALRWHTICQQLIGELQEIRYKTRSSGEQLRSEVALFERSLERCARICADLVRLGIEDRAARVQRAHTERLAEMLSQLMPALLTRAGLDYTDDTVRRWVAEEMAVLPGVSKDPGA